MGKFWGGLVVGLVLFPVAGAVYFLGGFAPAAVGDRPFPLEKIIAGGALETRIRREAPKRDLSNFSAADIVAGASAYRDSCSGCHGLPAQVLGGAPPQPTPNMYPPPPQLFAPDGYVTDDPPGVTYWKIVNGIRLTGMPSFKDAVTDQQAWQIAALLGNADKLSAEALGALKPEPPPGSAPTAMGAAQNPAKATK